MEFRSNQNFDFLDHKEKQSQQKIQNQRQNQKQKCQPYFLQHLPMRLEPIVPGINQFHTNMQQVHRDYSSNYHSKNAMDFYVHESDDVDYDDNDSSSVWTPGHDKSFEVIAVSTRNVLDQNIFQNKQTEFVELRPTPKIRTTQSRSSMLPLLGQQKSYVQHKQEQNRHSVLQCQMNDTSIEVDIIPTHYVTKMHTHSINHDNDMHTASGRSTTKNKNSNFKLQLNSQKEDPNSESFNDNTFKTHHIPEIWCNETAKQNSGTFQCNLGSFIHSSGTMTGTYRTCDCPQYYETNRQEEVQRNQSSLTKQSHSIPYNEVMHNQQTKQKRKDIKFFGNMIVAEHVCENNQSHEKKSFLIPNHEAKTYRSGALDRTSCEMDAKAKNSCKELTGSTPLKDQEAFKIIHCKLDANPKTNDNIGNAECPSAFHISKKDTEFNNQGRNMFESHIQNQIRQTTEPSDTGGILQMYTIHQNMLISTKINESKSGTHEVSHEKVLIGTPINYKRHIKEQVLEDPVGNAEHGEDFLLKKSNDQEWKQINNTITQHDLKKETNQESLEKLNRISDDEGKEINVLDTETYLNEHQSPEPKANSAVESNHAFVGNFHNKCTNTTANNTNSLHKQDIETQTDFSPNCDVCLLHKIFYKVLLKKDIHITTTTQTSILRKPSPKVMSGEEANTTTTVTTTTTIKTKSKDEENSEKETDEDRKRYSERVKDRVKTKEREKSRDKERHKRLHTKDIGKLENRPKWGVNRPNVQYVKASDRDPFFLRNKKSNNHHIDGKSERSQSVDIYMQDKQLKHDKRDQLLCHLDPARDGDEVKEIEDEISLRARNVCTEIVPIKTDERGCIFLNFREARAIMNEAEIKHTMQQNNESFDRILPRRNFSSSAVRMKTSHSNIQKSIFLSNV